MKLWKLLLLGIGLCCQSFACQPPTPPLPPVIDTTPQPLWSQARDGGSGVYGWFPQFIYGNNLITYTKKNGRAYIVALNKDNGREIWAWSDLLIPQEEAKTDAVHIYDDICVWKARNRVYAINLLTGQTVWKHTIITNAGFNTDGIAGLGNRFLIHGWDPIYFSGFVHTGNIIANPTLKLPYRTLHAQTTVFLNSRSNLLTQANINDTLAVLPYGTPEGGTATLFTIYNLTQNKEIYTKTIPGDTSGAFGPPPTVFNGKIYSPSGTVILCFDLQTGNELWRTRFSSVDASGLVIANNKIYSSNENGNTYCLDTETGKILWQTRTRGGASRPFFMNGVIYFTSIADGHLYGLDAETGAILMKIDDPRGGIGFGDMVAGADGKIYANTYTHLYCFKAAR